MQHRKNILKRTADFFNPFAWITKARNTAFDCGWLASRSFNMPVICIGNISVGGTGKTPHTEYLIRLLREKTKVAVLSRGYGRDSKGYIKADGETSMNLIGDEPHQMKSKFPDITVAVCEKRVAGAERLLADEKKPDVILLDDAYQHRHIKAGLYILLIDSNHPIWDDCLMPFGRLRESEKGAKRADMVIMTKCDKDMTTAQMDFCRARLKTKKETPVFFSTVEYGSPYPLFPDAETASIEEGTNILLVTGIAKPLPLKKEIECHGASVTLMQYADHHKFTPADIESIAAAFDKMSGRKYIITTEKDATRLRETATLPQTIRKYINALPIEVRFLNNDENMFNQIITDYVTENRRDR